MQTCLRASGGESFFQLSISCVYIENRLENNAFSSSSEKDQFMSGAQLRAQAQFIEFTGYSTSSSSTKHFRNIFLSKNSKTSLKSSNLLHFEICINTLNSRRTLKVFHR